MGTPESPEAVIHRFAGLLDAAQIPYMLTGSFASGFFGSPRATQDIDLVIAPTGRTLTRFVESLDPDSYYVSLESAQNALRRESLFNVVDYASGWKIDLICRKSRPFGLTEFGRRGLRDLSGTSVYVASAEDIILSKLEWSKAAGSERQLRDAISILKIQGDSIDQDYLTRWATELGVTTELDLAREEAGGSDG